jgi:hypothetical protein
MVLTVAAIFAILLIIIFGILVKMSFTEEKLKKKKAPCPDYWEEVKNVSVVDVYPNKEYIYKNNQPFTTATNRETIGNNDVQGIKIMLNKNTPFIRILNENPKTITACKVPNNTATNVGNIYNGESLKIRNFRYGAETDRKNYTTIDKIPAIGTNATLTYNKTGNYYSIDPATYTALVNTGDNNITDEIKDTPGFKTPGFYWGTDCINNNITCHNGTDNGNIKIWGNNAYIPSKYYIDFTDNDWHAINMHKSQLCNLKDWANRNNIVWDGVTNIAC